MSTDLHISELIPAYALDCLDEDELVMVSEHLEICSACRAELRSYQTVADQLVLAVPDAAPPPELKRRLMDRVQSSRPTPPPQPRLLWWRSLTTLMQRTTPVWGLVSLLLILGLAVSNLLLWQQANRREITPPPTVMRTVVLVGTDAAPGASGVIVISRDEEHGTLVVEGLAALDQAQQYQLWLIQNGQRASGGLFSVSEDGYASLSVSSPEPLSKYSAFGVTIEPAGGSPGPTGDKVLGSPL